MPTARSGNTAFWSCAGFTLFSALVSATFSLLALGMNGGGHQHEYALYAASRSIALPLAALFAMTMRSRGGVAALAVAMTLVQAIDAAIGFDLHQPERAYGPMLFAAINLLLLLWLRRQTTQTLPALS